MIHKYDRKNECTMKKKNRTKQNTEKKTRRERRRRADGLSREEREDDREAWPAAEEKRPITAIIITSFSRKRNKGR